MPASPFRWGHGVDSDWRAACDQALSLVRGQGAPQPPTGIGTASLSGLGIVYASEHFASSFNGIAEHLRALTGIQHWVGGVGHGVLSTLRESMAEPAIVIMIADLTEDQYRIFSGERPVGRLLAERSAAGWRAGAALVHADPGLGDLPNMVSELSQLLEDQPVFGAVIGGEAELPGQLAESPARGGISGVVFEQSVAVVSRLTQGCAPLSNEHRISKCTGRYLLSLDGEPALDVMLRDLGVAEPIRQSRDGDALLRALPGDRLRNGLLIGLARDTPKVGFGDFQVRSLIGIDPENRLLAIAAELQEGSRAVFCTRDRDSARRDLIRLCTELREEIESEALQVRGALYYSCVARGRHLFGEDGAEMAIIRHNLGSIPMIGLFANGELANNGLFGYTGVLTLFT